MSGARFPVLSLILAFQVASCASLGSTSPYFRPQEGVLYAYGNFCGPSLPQFPTPRGENVEGRIRFLQSAVAVDSIDQACKSHDLCYEYLGHNTDACDRFLNAILRQTHAPPDVPRENRSTSQQCENLAYEINFAFAALKDPMMGAVIAPVSSLYGLNHAFVSSMSGWPEEGACRVSAAALERAYARSRQVVDVALYTTFTGRSVSEYDAPFVSQRVSSVISNRDLMGNTGLSRGRLAALVGRL